jgi:hypothetical protein
VVIRILVITDKEVIDHVLLNQDNMIINLLVKNLKIVSIVVNKDILLKIVLNVISLYYSARKPREYNRERNDRGGYRSGGRDHRGGDDRRER